MLVVLLVVWWDVLVDEVLWDVLQRGFCARVVAYCLVTWDLMWGLYYFWGCDFGAYYVGYFLTYVVGCQRLVAVR
jgi:hypothetical protein